MSNSSADYLMGRINKTMNQRYKILRRKVAIIKIFNLIDYGKFKSQLQSK